MPWSNKGDGWQGGGGSRGPWGQGPSGPSGGRGGGQQPPDLEELIKKGQDRLKNMLPGGGSGGGGTGVGAPGSRFTWLIVIIGLLAIWAYNSFYQVQANEQGVVLQFGKYHSTTPPGLHFLLWPVQTVQTVEVLQEQKFDFGNERGEGQMLAGDQNIVDIRFTVLWRIGNPEQYLFNIEDPHQLVRDVSESAMREIVGRTAAEVIRTRGRFDAQQQVRDLIQKTLDNLKAGVIINGVQLEKADPPNEVIDAFEEVQRAEQNQNKFIREAEQYRNKLLGDAKGQASKIVEDAKAYKSRVVAEAEGEAQRFKEVYAEYAKAKDVTRKRIFLETMEKVLGDSNKILIEQGAKGSGVVPYLPLPEIDKQRQGNTAGGNQ